MATQLLRIFNLEHVGTLPGGMGMPFDRAIVVDNYRMERHIITGQPQPVVVYRGDLSGAHAFVESAMKSEAK